MHCGLNPRLAYNLRHYGPLRCGGGMLLGGIRACVFDAYGTLFDVGSAVRQCADALGEKALALSLRWREKQLQYTWLRTAQGKYVDFSQVTREALEFALEELQLGQPGLAERLLHAFDHLDAYGEVPSVLRALKGAQMRIAILSNGSPAMLAALVGHSGIGRWLDAVYSVDSVHVYKPDPRTYQLAVDRLGTPAGQICFLSSNGWDAYGASSFGMRVVWCNRASQPPERLPGKPEAQLRSLDGLPALLGLAPGETLR